MDEGGMASARQVEHLPEALGGKFKHLYKHRKFLHMKYKLQVEPVVS